MRKFVAAVAALFLVFSAAACSSGEPNPSVVTVTATTTPEKTKSESTSNTATATAEAAAANAGNASQGSAECLVGSMGQPQFSGTECLNKVVSHCGDPSNMETGTTFFTDGTSGWTQQCANSMYPVQQQVQQSRANAEPSVEDTPTYEPAPETTISYVEASPWIQDQIDTAACLETSPAEAC